MGETVPAARIIGLFTNPRGDLTRSLFIPLLISLVTDPLRAEFVAGVPELTGLFDHAFGLMPFLLRVLPPV